MRKQRFNGENAEECKELDWVELSLDLEEDKKTKSTVKSSKKKKSKKSKKKKEDYSFDIEDVEGGFELEFDKEGNQLEKEADIRRSVDEKIIIQSEELKQRRGENGFNRFVSMFKRSKDENDAGFDDGESVSADDFNGHDKYKDMGVLPPSADEASSFRQESANWRYDNTPNVDTSSEEEVYEEYEYESFLERLNAMSPTALGALLMAVVLFILSILTTCTYADYRGVSNKLAAINNMPQYKEMNLPSYSDRQIDTLDVEMLEAAAESERDRKQLSLILTSVEKDLKVKLVDGTDSLVRNISWGVDIIDNDGNYSDYDDDDQDGIIHITDIKAGDYTVSIKDTEDLNGYEFPVIGQQVSVKAKVEYRVIANIREEIRKESEVNAELEDPNGGKAADVESGPPLEDTVEWVESTVSSSGDGYEEAFVDLSQTERLYAKINSFVAAINNFIDGTRARFRDNLIIGMPMMSLMRVALEDVPSEDGVSEDIVIPDSVNDVWDLINNATSPVNPSNDSTITSPFEINSSGPDSESEETGFSAVTNASINKDSATISIDESVSLSISYQPSNALTPIVSWGSSNPSVARVDSNGVVVGVSNGMSRITAVVNNSIMLSCDVTVKDKYEEAKIMISGASTVDIGERITLEATCVSSSDHIASWNVKSDDVVSLEYDGSRATVTGLRNGTAIITAVSEGGAKESIEIKVVGVEQREYADDAQLYDSQRNKLYVYDDGYYRLAKYIDYKNGRFSTYYRKSAGTLYTGWQTIGGYTYYYTSDHLRVTGRQIIGGVRYEFDDEGILSRGSGVLGIDVSKYQPTINWRSVKGSGVRYVIIRCGYRGAATGSLIQDPYFTSHIRGAKDAGLKVGIYFFSTALNETEAVEEASMCAELCSEYDIDYPIFIDVESSSRAGYNSLSVEQRTANIRAFCETISSAGYVPGLYANKTWLTKYIDTRDLDCKIWLAQYNSEGPTYNGHYDIWQFTSKGRVDGIDGNVDMDQSYLTY